jgi:hypothetical protein
MTDRLRLPLAVLICVCLALIGACGDDDKPTSLGGAFVKHLYFSQDHNANGLFELDMSTGAATLVGAGATGTTNATVGLTETTNRDVLIGSTWADIATIAADGSGANVLAGSVGVEALAMNLATGILYGSINGQFFTIDPATGLNSGNLTGPGTDIEGLAANAAANVLYGISRDDMNLYGYDIAGNSWSVIGNTGRSWLDAGLAYDHLARVLYAIDANTDALYIINPATAATALVGPLGTEAAGGLAFVGGKL